MLWFCLLYKIVSGRADSIRIRDSNNLIKNNLSKTSERCFITVVWELYAWEVLGV